MATAVGAAARRPRTGGATASFADGVARTETSGRVWDEARGSTLTALAEAFPPRLPSVFDDRAALCGRTVSASGAEASSVATTGAGALAPADAAAGCAGVAGCWVCPWLGAVPVAGLAAAGDAEAGCAEGAEADPADGAVAGGAAVVVVSAGCGGAADGGAEAGGAGDEARAGRNDSGSR